MAAARRVLVIRHSEIDQPGFFGEVMEQAGIEWRPCDPWQGEPFPALEDYDAVLAMGGPQQSDEEDVYPWLGTEKSLLREAVAEGMPVLGVCLGCQLLADAHGGTVQPLAEAEVGIIDFALTEAGRADPLFAGLPPAPLTMQWHLNAVTAMPAQAELLATSEACAVQAYRLAPRAYGVQFHMEVDAKLVQATELFPEYVAALERDQGEGAFARMVADAVREEETLRANGSRLFRNFVDMMEAEGGRSHARRPAA